MNLVSLALSNPLILNACIAAILASCIGGVMGTFVVIKRMSFFSGSISHAILGGIGLSLWLERVHALPLPPLVGAILAALLSTYLCTVMKKSRNDATLTALWTTGMSLGIIFISITPGYTTDLSSYLIGNILWVSHEELIFLTLLLFISLFFSIKNFQALQLTCFDPVEARIQGINTKRLDNTLLLLIALTVVALIQIVGVILVMSLLCLPQMVSLLSFKRLGSVLIGSALISCLVTLSGMQLAITMDLPVGATIACLAALLFSITYTIKNKVVV